MQIVIGSFLLFRAHLSELFVKMLKHFIEEMELGRGKLVDTVMDIHLIKQVTLKAYILIVLPPDLLPIQCHSENC